MRKKSTVRAAVSVLLVLTFMLGIALPAPAVETSIEKPVTTYDIAVVYDNSASMYNGDSANSWCRAKFAMEIFGSMLNFANGDRMTIFPMWYVSTEPTPAVKAGTVKPVTIESIEDLDKIRYMFTPGDDGRETPFTPVDEAFSFLQSSDKKSPGGNDAEKGGDLLGRTVHIIEHGLCVVSSSRQGAADSGEVMVQRSKGQADFLIRKGYLVRNPLYGFF